jgi:ribosomal protein S18 acetylase RimI-like enzyme
MSDEPQFLLADESDADVILKFMQVYYAFDGHGFEREKAREALTALLRDPSLGRDAFVDEFYLLEEYRGRGWGRRAMKFVEDAARAAGIRTLHLEVVESNTAALQLYRKLGFTEHRSTFLSKWIAQDSTKPRGRTGL